MSNCLARHELALKIRTTSLSAFGTLLLLFTVLMVALISQLAKVQLPGWLVWTLTGSGFGLILLLIVLALRGLGLWFASDRR